MTRWRNSPQKKDQEETTARDLLKIDTSNTSEQELRTTVIRILARLEKSIEDTRETLAAEREDLKTSQAKIKNAVTEMQNRLDGITMRMEEAKKTNRDMEDKIMENNEAEEGKELCPESSSSYKAPGVYWG